VYAWDRVGAAVSAILRDYFMIPVVRYVDDLFWAETEESATSCRQLVLDIVSLLGFTLEPSKTPEPSTSLDILGVTVSLQSTISGLVISTVPDKAKVDFWLKDIQDCLSVNSLPLGLASQLVGRLSFAAWAAWGHIARSRLRSLYDFLLCGAGKFSLEVRKSLLWWEHRLQSLVPRLILLKEFNSAVILIYTDAEGSGGLGALLSGTEPSEWFMGKAAPLFEKSLLPRKTDLRLRDGHSSPCCDRLGQETFWSSRRFLRRQHF
jgi:hypothetical protein